MSATPFPIKYAMLAALVAQLFAIPVQAAKPSKDSDEDESKVCEDCPGYGGQSAWVEVGLGLQSDDSAHLGRYSGTVDDGAIINLNGAVSYRGKLDGAYLDGQVEDLGLDSRRLSVEAGKQGVYGVAVEYDRIPNERAHYTNATLRTDRERAGVKVSYLPARAWEVNAHYRHETKDGTRDLGAVFGFGNPTILPVAFSYKTDDFGVAVGYQGERFQARLAYDGSLFDGGDAGITWNNAAPPPASGQIAEAPDNEFHKLTAQIGYQITDHTRIGASYARGHMTQNEAFLPFRTTLPTLAMPASSLNGEVDTTLAKLDIHSRPVARLRLDASYSYSNRDNNTPVNTYNYAITDTSSSPFARQNRPYSFEQQLLRLKAGYRVSSGTDVSGGFDFDQMDRTYQQAESTQDQTLWFKLKMQPVEGLDAALRVSHAKRDASNYDPTLFGNPGFPESGATPGDPVMKAFEMADRQRDKVGLDLTYGAGESVTAGLNIDYYQDEYNNMVLGLTDATGLSITPTLTVSLSDDLSGSLYYTHERLKSEQTGREWIVTPATSTIWAESDTNTTDTVGIGINWKAIPDKLEIGGEASYSDFSGKIQYPGGQDLPELSSRLTAISLHGVYKMDKKISLRADYRYENYESYDWANMNVASVTSLGLTPEKQEAHLVFLSLRYEFK